MEEGEGLLLALEVPGNLKWVVERVETLSHWCPEGVQ